MRQDSEDHLRSGNGSRANAGRSLTRTGYTEPMRADPDFLTFRVLRDAGQNEENQPMLWKKLSALTLLILATSPGWAQSCTAFNTVLGPFYYGSINTVDHAGGDHTFSNETMGGCEYEGYGAGTQCTANATATSFSYMEESGKLVYPGFVHETAWADAGSNSTAQAPSTATAVSEGGGGIRECLLSCGFTASISKAGAGVSFSAVAKWSDKHTYTNTCPAKSFPANNGGCGGRNQNPCPICTPEGCGPSPILIDTRNEGFHFTDPQTPDGYVSFRFGAKILKVSFPDPRFQNKWLVRAFENGKRNPIDGADDLEGNFSPYADGGLKGHPNPNGFLDLMYRARLEAKAAHTSYTGVLSRKTAPRLWRTLRLWKPEHCQKQPDQACTALDSELETLDHAGVHSLSLTYSSDLTTDSYGNVCSFKAMVNPDEGETQKSRDGRYACDFNLAERREDAR